MATYLANFRNYIYYHIQAQKCYLHSRILKRINVFHKVKNSGFRTSSTLNSLMKIVDDVYSFIHVIITIILNSDIISSTIYKILFPVGFSQLIDFLQLVDQKFKCEKVLLFFQFLNKEFICLIYDFQVFSRAFYFVKVII